MPVSALTYTIGKPTPPAAQGHASQVQGLLQDLGGEPSSGTGGGASAVTPPSNPAIKAFGVASESVTITLSAPAQRVIAQQNPALDQLRQVNQQVRNSNHNAAADRLKRLLQEFHALQQFGTASARALAALAKQISAAAADLSAGDGNGAAPTTDTSFANETSAAGQATDEPDNAQADEGSAASATSPTAAINSNAPQAAGTTAAPTQSAAANAPPSQRQDAATVGSQTADSRSAATDPSSASNPNAVATSIVQRQSLLDHLKEQAAQNAARTQDRSADRDLLTQAANAISAIQGIVKQAAQEGREKHRGKSGTELAQLAKTVESSAAEVEKALGRVAVAPVTTPLTSTATAAVGINITV